MSSKKEEGVVDRFLGRQVLASVEIFSLTYRQSSRIRTRALAVDRVILWVP